MNDILTLLSIILIALGYVCLTPYISVVVLEKRLPNLSRLYTGTRRLARIGQFLAITALFTSAVKVFL